MKKKLVVLSGAASLQKVVSAPSGIITGYGKTIG